jgi:uroporphyrinogen-III synthase
MPGRKVLITRAEPGAQATARLLRDRGYEPVLCPTFTLSARTPWPQLDAHTAALLVFTSAMGVRVFAAHESLRTLPVWTVGEATAKAARLAGFTEVHAGPGDASALARTLLAMPDDFGETLITGHSEGAFDMAAALHAEGRRARFAATYDAHDRPSPTLEAAAALAAAAPLGLIIHSRRAASVVADWLRTTPHLAALHVAAISASAVAPLETTTLAAARIAAQPVEAALIDALVDMLPPAH